MVPFFGGTCLAPTNIIMKKLTILFLILFLTAINLSATDLKKGIKLYKAKSYKEAKKIFLEIIKTDIKNYTAYLYLGRTSKILNNNDNAILALQKAIELRPEKVDPYMELAEIYLNTKHYDLAEKYCSYALQNDKQNSRHYYILGRIYFNKGNYQKAKLLFQKACTLNPENAYYYNYIGLAYLKLNQNNKANTAFLTASALDHSVYFFYFNLGLSYESLKNWKSAADSFIKCLKLNKKYDNAVIHLKKAREMLRKQSKNKKKNE